MTHDEMIAVIQAHKNGKRLQFRDAGSGKEWETFAIANDVPSWNFNKYEYQVKPKPREFRLRFYKSRDSRNVWVVDLSGNPCPLCEEILVREVIE